MFYVLELANKFINYNDACFVVIFQMSLLPSFHEHFLVSKSTGNWQDLAPFKVTLQNFNLASLLTSRPSTPFKKSRLTNFHAAFTEINKGWTLSLFSQFFSIDSAWGDMEVTTYLLFVGSHSSQLSTPINTQHTAFFDTFWPFFSQPDPNMRNVIDHEVLVQDIEFLFVITNRRQL